MGFKGDIDGFDDNGKVVGQVMTPPPPMNAKDVGSVCVG